jgi:capsular exopolysaccharide synthesis family protein
MEERHHPAQSLIPAPDPHYRYPARPQYVDLGPHYRPGDLGSGDLWEYWNGLRRRKGLLFLLALAGVVVGFVTVIPKPFVYRCTTSVEIQGLNETFMGLNQVDPQASAGQFSASTSNILTQVKILNSDSLKRRVLEKLERETIPSLPPEQDRLVQWMSALRRLLATAPTEPAAALREALGTAVGGTRAKAVEGTRVVEILCESTHPEVAAEYCNSLVNEYLGQSLEGRSKSVQRTNQWLLSQIDEMRTKVEQAEGKLRDFVATAGVLGLNQLDQRSTLAEAKLQQLQQELSAIQADRINKQARYEMASASPPDAVPDIIDDGSLRSYQAKITDLRRELADLTATLTPTHYRVRKVQAQLAELEAALQRERGSILRRIKNDYEAAQRRERLLSAAYAAQAKGVLSQADKSLQYNLLRREVDTTRQIYNAMLQQVNQAGVASAIPTTNVQVIDPAVPSMRPSLSDVWIRLGLGLATGLLFGCVLAVVLQQHDPRVRMPGQASQLLHIPELGVIPSDREGAGRPAVRVRVRKGPTGLSLRGSERDGASAAAADAGRVELVTLRRKPSPVAESFRATLVSILLPHGDGSQPRIMVVTSPEARDGKSTTVSNLGIALAEIRRRVLLIDADLRNPRLHEVFRLPNTWGLTDLIQETTPIAQLPPEALVRPTEVPGLYLLPSGPPTLVINNILYSARIHELLERLGTEFDNILIDTPPVLVAPDARVLGGLADGVILVFRSGKTTRDAAVEVRQRFADDGTPIVGAILNDWDPKSRRYGYYHHYYSGHERG